LTEHFPPRPVVHPPRQALEGVALDWR